jgi:hypothetical protein
MAKDKLSGRLVACGHHLSEIHQITGKEIMVTESFAHVASVAASPEIDLRNLRSPIL